MAMLNPKTLAEAKAIYEEQDKVIETLREELELETRRIDWMEENGRWADMDQFLIGLEDNWWTPNGLRTSVDDAMEKGLQ